MEELDLITLTTDLPDYDLKAGDRGTIVLVHGQGEAFEVEFIKAGRTVAVTTLESDQVQLWEPDKAPSPETPSPAGIQSSFPPTVNPSSRI